MNASRCRDFSKIGDQRINIAKGQIERARSVIVACAYGNLGEEIRDFSAEDYDVLLRSSFVISEGNANP